MNKNFTNQIIGLFFALAGLSSCTKDLSENFNIYSNNAMNDTVWTSSLPASAAVYSIFDSIAPKPLVDSFDATTGATLYFPGDIELTFQANSCIYNSGTPVTGKITVELISLLSKGNLVKAMQATMNNKELLETAGSFFVRVTKNGMPLSLAPNASYKIKYCDADIDPNILMNIFGGKETQLLPLKGFDPEFTWIKLNDGSSVSTWSRINQNGALVKGYEITAKNFKWISVSKYFDNSLPKYQLTAILPLNFTNKNTVVFAIIEKNKTVVQMAADFMSRSFTAINIPQGNKATIVSISKIGNSFYFDEKSSRDAGPNGIIKLNPEKKTLRYILEEIGSF